MAIGDIDDDSDQPGAQRLLFWNAFVTAMFCLYL